MKIFFIITGVVVIIAAVIFIGRSVVRKSFSSVKYEFKNGFKELAQAQLNTLVADIEFYRIKHGYYPDSLTRLLDLDKWTFINDPLQANFQNRSTYYNYGRIGQKYFLFSSGTDGISHTSDDLYPQVGPIDSTKIGLLGPDLRIPK